MPVVTAYHHTITSQTEAPTANGGGNQDRNNSGCYSAVVTPCIGDKIFVANGLKAKGLGATDRLEATNRLEASDNLKATNNLKAKSISSKDRFTSPTLKPATNEKCRCNQHTADGEASVVTMLGVFGNPLTHF